MFDSDDPAVLETIQFVPARVATYADLLTPSIVAKFGPRLAVIDRGLGDPMNRAHIVDIEPGALSVGAGATRIHQWAAEGRPFPTVYVNRENWDQVLAACLPVRPYAWVATLDGTLNPNGTFPHLTQFAGADKLGLHADVSVVWDEGWLPQTQLVKPDVVTRTQAAADQLVTLSATIKALSDGL